MTVHIAPTEDQVPSKGRTSRQSARGPAGDRGRVEGEAKWARHRQMPARDLSSPGLGERRDGRRFRVQARVGGGGGTSIGRVK